MLCMPMGRDQPMVAERARELGLARVCPADETTDSFARHIEAALEDDALRRSARSFAAETRQHPGTGRGRREMRIADVPLTGGRE